MAQWRQHDPPYLAGLISPDCSLSIFFDCGTEDEYIEYPANVAFANSLDALGQPYEFQSFPGGHTNQFFARFRVGLAWLGERLEEPTCVAFDIKPGSCPNPLNTKGKGVLPAAILGTAGVDVHDIDVSTLLLDGIVAPIHHGYEDLATPILDDDPCACTEAGPDGYEDLTITFDKREVVAALGPLADGEMREITLTGQLIDGAPIAGGDCVVVLAGDEDEFRSGQQAASLTGGLLPARLATGKAQLRFALAQSGQVEISIYDINGRLTRSLVDCVHAAGEHDVLWDGRNDEGLSVAAGVYFARMRVDTETVGSGKILMLR
jgi:hypothetical protein